MAVLCVLSRVAVSTRQLAAFATAWLAGCLCGLYDGPLPKLRARAHATCSSLRVICVVCMRARRSRRTFKAKKNGPLGVRVCGSSVESDADLGPV